VRSANLLARLLVRVIGRVVRAAGLDARDGLRELRLKESGLATESFAESLHDRGARRDV
jgi:hypothetical protein